MHIINFSKLKRLILAHETKYEQIKKSPILQDSNLLVNIIYMSLIFLVFM